MNIPDMINGFYELVGGLVIFYNCLILYRHKEVRGISVWVTIFFLGGLDGGCNTECLELIKNEWLK